MPASMAWAEVVGFKQVSQSQSGAGLAFFGWSMGDRVAGLPEGTFRGSIDFQVRLPWWLVAWQLNEQILMTRPVRTSNLAESQQGAAARLNAGNEPSNIRPGTQILRLNAANRSALDLLDVHSHVQDMVSAALNHAIERTDIAVIATPGKRYMSG